MSIDRICPNCDNVIPKSKPKNKFCSQSCSASHNNKIRGPRSEATKTKIRKSVKANPHGFVITGGNKNGRPPVDRISKTCPECKEIFETTIKQNKKFCNRTCSSKNSYHPNSTRKIRSSYKGFQMDSKSELIFAQLLDQHNVKWIKNSTTFFNFIDRKGKTRKYYPDFYLPTYDLWIEIKGKYYIREDDDLRLAAVPNIERIMSDNIKLPKIYVIS